MQRSTVRQNHITPRPAHPERNSTFVAPAIKQRQARKAIALRLRLVAAAAEADKGLLGTDVTDMSSKDFIALLRR